MKLIEHIEKLKQELKDLKVSNKYIEELTGFSANKVWRVRNDINVSISGDLKCLLEIEEAGLIGFNKIKKTELKNAIWQIGVDKTKRKYGVEL